MPKTNQRAGYVAATKIPARFFGTGGKLLPAGRRRGRWVFGSVTDKVLHSGDTPVLIVRPRENENFGKRRFWRWQYKLMC